MNPISALRVARNALERRKQRSELLRVATLEPGGAARGQVLLSFITDPFFLRPGVPISNAHTHDWETLKMAETWRDLGYEVDVIHWLNDRFVPRKRYDWFIDVRLNMERISGMLDPGCVKVMHIETAHWLFHAHAQYQRLLALQQRRGITLPPRKLVEPNLAIEHADVATILGNGFTMDTYRFAGKPFHRVPISAQVTYDWPDDKDFDDCRRRFVWFGSDGFIHKGLDLVLEAFSEMPDCHLTVCGPVHTKDRDFRRAFHKQLFETPNIETVGWVDVAGPAFTAVAQRSVGLIYPSCSEGGGGGAVLCMHAGLIPVISRETSVDVEDSFGVLLPDSSVPAIKEAVEELASRPASELESMARRAWEFARANHTREVFAMKYRETVEELISACGK